MLLPSPCCQIAFRKMYPETWHLLTSTVCHISHYSFDVARCKAKAKACSALSHSWPLVHSRLGIQRELTCHMMESRSFTYHPTEATFPRYQQPKLVLDLSTPDGWKAELSWTSWCEYLARGYYAMNWKQHRPGLEPRMFRPPVHEPTRARYSPAPPLIMLISAEPDRQCCRVVQLWTLTPTPYKVSALKILSGCF